MHIELLKRMPFKTTVLPFLLLTVLCFASCGISRETKQPAAFFLSMNRQKLLGPDKNDGAAPKYSVKTEYYIDPVQLRQTIQDDTIVDYAYEGQILRSISFRDAAKNSNDTVFTFVYTDENGKRKGVSNSVRIDAYHLPDFDVSAEIRFEIEYKNGRLLSLKSYCGSDAISGNEYTYYKSGRIKKHTLITGSVGLDGKADIMTTSVTTYTENGNIKENTLYGSDGDLMLKTTYRYKNGRQTETIKKNYGAQTSVQITRLTDSSDQADVYTEYDGDHTVTGYLTVYYNEDHYGVRSERTDTNGELKSHTISVYDENGNRTLQQYYNKNGVLESEIENSYSPLP